MNVNSHDIKIFPPLSSVFYVRYEGYDSALLPKDVILLQYFMKESSLFHFTDTLLYIKFLFICNKVCFLKKM